MVPVFEAGEADGVLYIAMRYVEGTDLRALDRRARAGSTPERAARITWQVAAALDAAHRRGLVHRDVKPAERADHREGEEHAYLTDFGLTKHAARPPAALTRRASSSAPSTTSRRSRSRATPPTPAPTSTRSAASSSTRSPGRVPFPRDSERRRCTPT